MTKQKRIGARKEQILKAAEQVFAKKGFQQATISEIAREANVSDATIYEYFPTKEELLFTIPFETTRKGKKDLLLHLSLIRGAANKMRALIYWYLHFFEHHPDYGAVVLLILKSNREFLKTDTYQVVREWARLFVDIIKEGMESGEFKKDIDPYLVRSVILGTIEHSVISWLLIGRPKDLLSLVDPLTDLVVNGINKEDAMDTSRWNINISLERPQEKKISDMPAENE
ncbi:MAG: TetR/AcrR family transcriptional regulator [Deltaproteobacteria bacterium]|nr:TetR/AcrR family transcriptional regulator [Deltaproteobacteria bacterium]